MEVHIVSFSGGKDSTAMLFKLIEQGEKIDYILFVDMGAEYPEMYKHIEQVNQKLKKYNLRVTVLKPKYTLFEYMTIYKKKRGKYAGLPYAFPSLQYRWCSALKRDTINRFKAQLKASTVDYIGYTVDEIKRARKLKQKETMARKYRFPLIELGMTEKDALKYCYSLGFDWGGLYEHLDRVSCFMCPFQNNKGLRYLVTQRPELWEKIKQLESSIKEKGIKYWKFKPNKSCEDIESMMRSDKYHSAQKTLLEYYDRGDRRW